MIKHEQLQAELTKDQVLAKKIQNLCEQQLSVDALQDDYGLYIPPSGSNTAYSQQIFDLTGAVSDFVEGNKTTLLLLGNSGSGKSFFGQAFILRKLQEFKAGETIPLFISLPTLRQPTTNLIPEFLKRFQFTDEEITTVKQSYKFLLFLDAYDEINRWENLYLSNKLNEWQSKIIISCRSDYTTTIDNYQRYFMPFKGGNPLMASFQELHVAHFVPKQIKLYIQQYLQVKKLDLEKEILMSPNFTKDWLETKTYENWIDKIPNLKSLVQTPFLLRITMEVLPSVAIEYQNAQDLQNRYNMTSVKLYDAFTMRWFRRREDKLMAQGESVSHTFQKDCLAFAKALAKKMHEKKLTQVSYEINSSIEDMFDDNPVPDVSTPNEWAIFFSDDLLPQDKNNPQRQQARINARKACPLRKVGTNQYAFLHASLLDYFVTISIVVPPIPPNPSILEQETAGKLAPSNQSGFFNGKKVLGEFIVLNKITRQQAELLAKEEGVQVDFGPHEQEKSFLLGKGVFGKLKIAQNIKNNRFAVVKVINEELKIKLSQAEAEMQNQLNGVPYIMPIWHSELGANKQGKPVLKQVMPLASFGDGELLKKQLEKVEDDSIKVKIVTNVAKSLLLGLKGMHRRRVYHLDIKPSNFVIDARGYVYIIDFGCAVRKYDNSYNDLISGVSDLGDTAYYAPERLAYKRKLAKLNSHELADNYDGAKADAWALGLSLIEIISGDNPFLIGHIDDRIRYWDSVKIKQLLSYIDILDNPSDEFKGLIDAIKQLLIIDKAQRLSPTQALELPIFKNHVMLPAEEFKKLLLDMKDKSFNIKPAAAHPVNKAQSSSLTANTVASSIKLPVNINKKDNKPGDHYDNDLQEWSTLEASSSIQKEKLKDSVKYMETTDDLNDSNSVSSSDSENDTENEDKNDSVYINDVNLKGLSISSLKVETNTNVVVTQLNEDIIKHNPKNAFDVHADAYIAEEEITYLTLDDYPLNSNLSENQAKIGNPVAFFQLEIKANTNQKKLVENPGSSHYVTSLGEPFNLDSNDLDSDDEVNTFANKK